MKKIIIFILFLLPFGLIGCDRRTVLETVDPIVAEHYLFDDSISSALRIVGNPRLKESTDTIFTMQYSITTITRIRQGTSRQVDYYQFDWIYEDDTREIYFNLVENELRQDPLRSVLHNFFPFSYHPSEHLTEVLGKILYSYYLEEEFIERTYLFKEELLQFSPALLEEIQPNTSLLNYRLEFMDFDDEDFYRFKLHIDFVDNTQPYHLDLQSWIITKSGDAFPFIGLYNFTELGTNYESVTDIRIYKYIPIEQIFFQFNYYDTSESLTTIYDLVSFASLDGN